MATRIRFYSEDTVALKEDPSIIAIVEETWRDVDSSGSTTPGDLITHKGISSKTRRDFRRDGLPPTGHVIIRLILPYHGTALIKEEDLILVDRGLVIGDVVKRSPSDAQSGTVLKVHEVCEIEPIYNKLPFHGNSSWSHKAEDNILTVPAEELRNSDLEEGDRIVYQDWFGEISGVDQNVTVRLDCGSIVTVQDADRLWTLDDTYEDTRTTGNHSLTLAKILRVNLKVRQAATPSNESASESSVGFWPGQTVLTTKANLRLGTWLVGQYSPNDAPRGVVVDVRTTLLNVEWIATKLFDTTKSSLRKPDDILDGSDLDQIRVYNDANTTSRIDHEANTFGSRRSNDLEAGNIVKFRDAPGAAVKYSTDAANPAGVFRRIPRDITDGFDMNTFRIRRTSSTATIQWQDGTIIQHPAIDLLPYLNVDEHDVWCGDVVSLRSAETPSEDDQLLWLQQVGVVQKVDAAERTAQIRWFERPHVAVFKHQTSMLFSGADLGSISDRITTEALFDITDYPELSKRRGDLVVLSPNSVSQALHTATSLMKALENGTIPELPELPELPKLSNPDTSSDPQNILSKTESRWLGEIVDMTLDGQLRVRLAALDHVEDIIVPIQRVTVAVGGDADDFGSVEDDGVDSYDSDMDLDDWDEDFENEQNAVEETIYEGGERLDDGDEDAWTTDGTDDSDHPPKEPNGHNGLPVSHEDSDDMSIDGDSGSGKDTKQGSKPIVQKQDLQKQHLQESEQDRNDQTPLPAVRSTPPKDLPIDLRLSFSSYPSMPAQFEIIDGAPTTHHYLSSTPSLTAPFLRRITKEHNILSTSLPQGIWVRTWSDRLDLTQVLILGPTGTPYALAPFLFDFHFRPDYPYSPPEAFFHSWTNKIGRINPNLYEDGKVCLSVLGTWHTNEDNEGWNGDKSSLLQVIVSLLGLVLVEDPYYNEAGFDTLINAEEYIIPAKIYAEKALCMSKGFLVHSLKNDPGVMIDPIEWLYLHPDGPLLLDKVIAESQQLLDRRNNISDAAGVEESKKPLSAGAEALLKRYLPTLQQMSREFQGIIEEVSAEIRADVVSA